MKKAPLLFLLGALLFTTVWAQEQSTFTVPQGMQYQAVARDLDGQVIADQVISLKITLHSDINRESTEYSELHKALTNEIGLFTLVIGEGQAEVGSFSDVPWSSRDIWMEVAIQDEQSSDFTTISNSRLLAVPYAFHAGTAAELLRSGDDRAPGSGVPANNWHLKGNSSVDENDKLGTTQCADLIIVTNDIERLRVTCEGQVNIVGTVNIGANLNVDSNVTVNIEGGSTVINGDLTVENMSSTYLTGTLEVDKATDLNSTLDVDGATNLNNTLEVDGATDLNNNLNVDGTTDLNDDLTVTGMSATHLTGTLEVDKATNLHSTVEVDGATDLNSTLNVDGNTTLNNDLTVTGMNPTELTGTLEVDKNTTLREDLLVEGDATFEGEVSIDGQINASAAYISGSASLPIGGQTYVACFENTSSASEGTDGVAIKIGQAGSSSDWHDDGDNDYLTFFNGLNQATGAVEGFEILNDNPISTFPELEFSNFFSILDFSSAITLPSVDFANLIDFDPPGLSIDFTGFDFSFDIGGLSVDFANEFDPGGFDPGAFFNPSAAGGATQAIADIVCWGISNGMESLITTNPFDLILATTVIVETNLCKENNGKGGVTYVSFGADYAEWLPRANPNETMKNGQIVGVKNGKISKSTENADQILAISTNPIVLGNMPPASMEELYEKVGFMGQVPVICEGKVRVGDYIIPSGKNDGIGKAIPADELEVKHIPQILGRAWSDSDNDFMSYINVAVGLNRNDIAAVAMKQEKEIESLKSEMASIRETLDGELSDLIEKVQLLEADQKSSDPIVRRNNP